MAGNLINSYAPVLALHCSLGSSAQWRSLARAMPERTVIATDLMGYGDAPFPAHEESFSLDHEVDAIERELLRSGIGTRPLHLVGHSYGGAVAFRFALRNPDRVKSIALFEPVTIWLLRRAFADCVTAEISGTHMAPVENRVQVDSAIAAFIRKSERLASVELKVA